MRLRALAFVALLGMAACHREMPAVTSAPTAPTRPVELVDLTLDGSAPDEDLAPRMAPHVERVVELAERCYEPRLAARPDLEGVHALRLWVSAREVIRVTPEEPTLGDPEVELCIKRALLAYEIPPRAPSGGVRVRFKLVFTPPSRL